MVKVGDFYLARSMFEEDYYQETDNNLPMPVKWMAIECLCSYAKFTESSDVVGFFITVAGFYDLPRCLSVRLSRLCFSWITYPLLDLSLRTNLHAITLVLKVFGGDQSWLVVKLVPASNLHLPSLDNPLTRHSACKK